MTHVRLFDDSDAAAAAGIIADAFPFLVSGADYLKYRRAIAAPRLQRLDLVAEVDGEVVGYAASTRDEHVPDLTKVQLIVAANRRRQGIGSALFDRLSTHWNDSGAGAIATHGSGQPAYDFAAHRGFNKTRAQRVSQLPLTEFTHRPTAPVGITLRRTAELADLRPVHEVESATVADIPGEEEPQPVSFDDWMDLYGNDPRMDRDNTVVAFDGDRPVSLAWLDREADVVWSGYTCTLPLYRGRGLALTVKTAALAHARDDGATVAYTNNDATNAAMLAVNTKLGYRPYVEQYELRRPARALRVRPVCGRAFASRETNHRRAGHAGGHSWTGLLVCEYRM